MIAGSAISTSDDIHEDSNSKRTILDLNGEEAIHIEAESGRKRVRVDTLQLTGNIQAESADLADGEIIYRKNEKKYDIGGANIHIPVIESNLETYYNTLFNEYDVFVGAKALEAKKWQEAHALFLYDVIDGEPTIQYYVEDYKNPTISILDPSAVKIPFTLYQTVTIPDSGGQTTMAIDNSELNEIDAFFPVVYNPETGELKYEHSTAYPYIAAAMSKAAINLYTISRFAFQVSQVKREENDISQFNYGFLVGFGDPVLTSSFNWLSFQFSDNCSAFLKVSSFNWTSPTYLSNSVSGGVVQDPYVIPDETSPEYESHLPEFWNPDKRKHNTKGFAFAKLYHTLTDDKQPADAYLNHKDLGASYNEAYDILYTGQLEKVKVFWDVSIKQWRVDALTTSKFFLDIDGKYVDYDSMTIVSPTNEVPLKTDNPRTYSSWIGIFDALGRDEYANVHFKYDFPNNLVYIGCESKLFQHGTGYNPLLQTCNIPEKIYWNTPLRLNHEILTYDQQYFCTSAFGPNINSTGINNNGITSYSVKPIPISTYLKHPSTRPLSLDLSTTQYPLSLPIIPERDISNSNLYNNEGLFAYNQDKRQVQLFTSEIWKSLAFQQTLYTFPLVPVKNDDWYIYNNTWYINELNLPYTNHADLTVNGETKTFRKNSTPASGEELIQTFHFEYRINKLKFHPRQTFKIRPRHLMEYYVNLESAGQPLFFYNSDTWQKLDTNLGVQASSLSSDWASEIHSEAHNASLIRIRLPDCDLLEEWEELNYTFILDIPDINQTATQFAEIEFYMFKSSALNFFPQNRTTIYNHMSSYNLDVSYQKNVFRTNHHNQNNGDKIECTITRDFVYFNGWPYEVSGLESKFSQNVLISSGH